MDRFKELLVDGLRSIADLFRSTKEAYEGANRFARLRIWILGIFTIDVLATLIFVFSVGGRAIDLEVWFEQGFPSNMLVVRNEEGAPLKDVLLLLDNRYRLEVKLLKPGLQGFEVNRQFRDAEELTPSEDYRPRRLEVRAGGAKMQIAVGTRPQ